MKKNNWMVILTFIACTNLYAKNYDPFYLRVFCYPDEPYCFLGKNDFVPIFYFVKELKKHVENLLLEARRELRKITVDLEYLASDEPIILRNSIWIPLNSFSLGTKQKKIDQVIKIADEEIDFKWANLSKDNIEIVDYLLLPTYIKITLNGETKRYSLTREQKSRFNELFDHQVTEFRVNLSALEKKHYREYLPADKVILNSPLLN